ncbi:hypothetical protein HUB90_06570 [Wolbachia endosymbiont of Kradibia gibbosae]|uniref:hypothetical protein n=1 Tax=Wolbachia endosymbiont of Kradibia gibbosae TaxID=2742716 RepID=UPI0018D892EC|nr:hypothetical protein [Wolbachia endosymbiont of Kradibia gibbosae]MBH5362655.1 hypothetical protein [Wolbachia endosymbiont of Kradibia gibbosae]
MNIYNKSWLSWYIGGLMEIQRLLSKTPEQLREYCESLGYEDKQNLYKQVVDEAKGKRLRELKQLSKLATAIEKTTDKKLLKPFRGDDNPLNGVVILSFFWKIK